MKGWPTRIVLSKLGIENQAEDKTMGRPKNTPFTPEDTVLDKMFAHMEIQREGGCVLWTGPVTPLGYGRVGYNGTRRLAHRVIFEKSRRRNLKPGEVVCHKCDNPACVNQKHLFVGDQMANVRDCIRKGRNTRGEKTKHAVLNPEKIEQIYAMRRQGLTQREIAERFDITRGHVGQILTANRWRHIKRKRADTAELKRRIIRRVSLKGDRHGRSKLAEAQVVEIKRRLAEGFRQDLLAQEYGVSKATVSLIASGKRWSHL